MGNVGMWSMDGSQNETEIFPRLVALLLRVSSNACFTQLLQSFGCYPRASSPS